MKHQYNHTDDMLMQERIKKNSKTKHADKDSLVTSHQNATVSHDNEDEHIVKKKSKKMKENSQYSDEEFKTISEERVLDAGDLMGTKSKKRKDRSKTSVEEISITSDTDVVISDDVPERKKKKRKIHDADSKNLSKNSENLCETGDLSSFRDLLRDDDDVIALSSDPDVSQKKSQKKASRSEEEIGTSGVSDEAAMYNDEFTGKKKSKTKKQTSKHSKLEIPEISIFSSDSDAVSRGDTSKRKKKKKTKQNEDSETVISTKEKAVDLETVCQSSCEPDGPIGDDQVVTSKDEGVSKKKSKRKKGITDDDNEEIIAPSDQTDVAAADSKTEKKFKSPKDKSKTLAKKKTSAVEKKIPVRRPLSDDKRSTLNEEKRQEEEKRKMEYDIRLKTMFEEAVRTTHGPEYYAQLQLLSDHFEIVPRGNGFATRARFSDDPRCPYCDKWFSNTFHRNYHVKAQHANIRPYVCDICGKAFSKGNMLRNHGYVHLEIRPYECPYCHLAFTKNYHLSKHHNDHARRRRLGLLTYCSGPIAPGEKIPDNIVDDLNCVRGPLGGAGLMTILKKARSRIEAERTKALQEVQLMNEKKREQREKEGNDEEEKDIREKLELVLKAIAKPKRKKPKTGGGGELTWDAVTAIGTARKVDKKAEDEETAIEEEKSEDSGAEDDDEFIARLVQAKSQVL